MKRCVFLLAVSMFLTVSGHTSARLIGHSLDSNPFFNPYAPYVDLGLDSSFYWSGRAPSSLCLYNPTSPICTARNKIGEIRNQNQNWYNPWSVLPVDNRARYYDSALEDHRTYYNNLLNRLGYGQQQ